MALSTNLISGLSSGIDWRTMIDQLIAVDHRSVDLVEDQKSEYESKLEIYQTINTKLLSFKTQASTLASSDAFNVFETSLSTNSTTYEASDFLSVTTGTTAATGTHTITMDSSSSVAKARQISSKSFSSYNTALGLSGEFVINGRALEVEAGDELRDIRDKVNNLNSGTNAIGVTASILTVSSSNYRLILTSDDTGEDAFTLFDASSDGDDLLNDGLGFMKDTTEVKNLLSNGALSEAFSGSSQSVSAMLGLTAAQTGTTVSIGSVNNITIDLSKSLTEIASDINDAVSATSIVASVVSSTTDGVTTYRLKIENTTDFTDDNHVLETLGILEGEQDSVEEIRSQETAINTDSDGSTAISGSTLLTNLWSSGSDSNVQDGDTITIKGKRGDGTSVNLTFTVGAGGDGTDIDALLTKINNSTNGFGYGSRTATASISGGKIIITDDTAGDSLLTLSLIANNEGGGTLNFGDISAETEGYTMEVQAGKDASITIDGTTITSSSNSIDDAITGVTLNLKTVESDKTVTINIERDYDMIKSSVQSLLDAYNDIITDINEQFAYDEDTDSAGLLQGDGTLSSIKSNLMNIVASSVSGISTTMNALSLIGINSQVDYTDHTNDGILTIDDDDFMDAMQDYFNDFMRVFIAEGTATDGDVEYISHTRDTVAGTYAVNITQAATQATVTGTATLTSGIGAGNIETISISQGGRIAAVTLDGSSGENGSSIDSIVNALNSEFDTEYTQTLMGDVKNTTDADQTTAITSNTTWNNVYSGGDAAGLETGDVITFTGKKSNGTGVSGSYTIVATNTVQGLLSAIESAYDNEVTAAINSYGYLVVTDKTTGSSRLDITIAEPEDKDLDFGNITTSNLVSDVRNTTNGTNAILSTTTFDSIFGSTVTTGDIFKYSGYTVDGNAVEGSFTVNLLNTSYDDIGDLLSEIKSAYDTAGGDTTVNIVDGRIQIFDGTTNSTLDLEIFEPTGKGVDLGTFSGGVTGRHSLDVTASKDGSDRLVLTHDAYGTNQSFTVQVSGSDLGLTDNSTHSGLDVAGTINGESATGSGQVLTGDAPGSGESTSIEGLIIKYTGTSTGAQGDVTITMGVAELFDRALFDITDQYAGYLAFKIDSTGDNIDSLETRIEEMEKRLDSKTELLINKFVAMEVALSKIQSMSNWLTGQANAASSGWVL